MYLNVFADSIYLSPEVESDRFVPIELDSETEATLIAVATSLQSFPLQAGLGRLAWHCFEEADRSNRKPLSAGVTP